MILAHVCKAIQCSFFKVRDFNIASPAELYVSDPRYKNRVLNRFCESLWFFDEIELNSYRAQNNHCACHRTLMPPSSVSILLRHQDNTSGYEKLHEAEKIVTSDICVQQYDVLSSTSLSEALRFVVIPVADAGSSRCNGNQLSRQDVGQHHV